MKIKKIDDSDCFLISSFVAKDDRGSFIKTFNSDQLTEIGIFKLEECFFSTNKKNVVRGMHYQSSPYTNNKIIFVTEGEIIDVFVDIRKTSNNFGKYFSIEISSEDSFLYIPRGFAHGFCTLEDETSVLYKVDNLYNKDHESGLNWKDPNLKIKWPSFQQYYLSEKDKSLPFFEALNKD